MKINIDRLKEVEAGCNGQFLIKGTPYTNDVIFSMVNLVMNTTFSTQMSLGEMLAFDTLQELGIIEGAEGLIKPNNPKPKKEKPTQLNS